MTPMNQVRPERRQINSPDLGQQGWGILMDPREPRVESREIMHIGLDGVPGVITGEFTLHGSAQKTSQEDHGRLSQQKQEDQSIWPRDVCQTAVLATQRRRDSPRFRVVRTH
jgi:hypothetical protein